MSGLIDLDELVLKCRDDRARQYIAEAVACYRGAAYRSCIVASWIAVTFDFLAKLQDLDLTGDPNAAKHLKAFEDIRVGGEARLIEALAFESDLLDLASREFELLSPLEKEDLTRLRDDRNRCAHPSMQSQNEPYQPTPETARAHLRNAVEIMLAREPVQGKAALARLFDEVRSEYFPETADGARLHFERGPLKRAKVSVIRSFLIGITKGYFFESKPSEERRRMRAAIGAAIEMHRAIAERIARNDLVEVIRRVPDDKYWMIIAFTSELPVIYEALDAPLQGKVKTYLSNASEKESVFKHALAVTTGMHDLRATALERIARLSSSDFADIVAKRPDPEFCERAVQLFSQV